MSHRALAELIIALFFGLMSLGSNPQKVRRARGLGLAPVSGLVYLQAGHNPLEQ